MVFDEGAAVSRAVFEDPDRFVAVLDADGAVRALNDAGADALGVDDAAAVEGSRLWGLPWANPETTRREVQRAVRAAADGGEYASFEAAFRPRGDAVDAPSVQWAFRVQPAFGGDGAADDDDDNDHDSAGRLVVQGDVRREREQLAEELRASEELHRVTLNNMTDTVLVTDEDGAFTYVCPNVHFIFGYTAEEIHGFGTIDELLGGDPADAESLAEDGVATNVEWTATDADGDEHALLVNVREVSIQGGTRLYSCRDVTKRKQREEALAQLQETSRELLYAGTATEAATRVVEDGTAALPAGGIAVYQFDRGENRLYPVAAADELDAAVSSVGDVRLDQQTPVSAAFVDDRAVDAGDDDWEGGGGGSEDPVAGLADWTAIPTGDHGVLLAATADGGAAAGGVGAGIARLLAATLEAALDRLDREAELRERDQRLQAQNRRLSEINRVNEIIREVDAALVDADSRADIETAVCERLTAEDRFAFAWVGDATAHGGRLDPREWAGGDSTYLDEVDLSTDEPASSSSSSSTPEPAVRTATSRSVTLVSNVADRLREADWPASALAREYDSVLSVPLVYDDVLFGTVTVYDTEPNAFSETVRAVFAELGETVGAAISSVQRKAALQGDSSVRLTYELRDRSWLLGRLAADLDCRLTAQSEVSGSDGGTRVVVAVSGADAADVVAAATGLVDVSDGEVVRATGGGDGSDSNSSSSSSSGGGEDGLVSLALRDGLPTAALTEYGAVRRRLVAGPEAAELGVEAPDAATVRAVDRLLAEQFADVELTARRQQPRASERRDERSSPLTERQAEVAQVAYHSGYFDADRDVTGRDVAETLGISHTAFYDHVRRIEKQLFDAVFDDPGGRWIE